ncbi:MAG: hypothetical protein DBX55_01690 [Verrucomicrobia bacterium]|nr:MAG: hypothetical protein DBX55_01690 [Verrucomicrobiota bacterium]
MPLFCAAGLFAESYYLESTQRELGTGDFVGFNPTADSNQFTATPEIPEGGITSEDDVTLEWFSDISGANVDVNTFEFISSGRWNNGFSFKNNVVIKARNIIFKSHWNNKTDTNNGIVYDPNNSDVRDAQILNIYSANLTLMGNFDNSSAIFYIGQPYSSGVCSLTLAGYDANTSATYNFDYISFNYDSKESGQNTLTINDGANVSIRRVYFSSKNIAESKTSTVNLNGGTFEVRNEIKVQGNGDSITFNHGGGTLKASENDLTIGLNETTANLAYNLGSGATFSVNSGKTLTIEDGVTISAISGQNADIRVAGGGTMKINASVDAVNGAVSVSENSVLDLGSSWVSNAQSVSIGAGSSITTSGNIELSDASKIVLSISGATEFASLAGASVTTSGEGYGSLIFDINAAAFEDGTEFSISLSELIAASDIDWSKFDISAGEYSYSIDGSNITFQVPEPSAYAAALGALALAFAAFRRRR